MLGSIETSANRGAHIVKQLLLFARGTPPSRAPLALGPLLSDTLRMVEQTFPRNTRVMLEAAEGVWPLLADSTQIQQVLMNLCLNARDAMPDGGRLTIASGNTRLDQAFCSMTPESKVGPYVCISVIDSGTGIPMGIRESIFEPFFTTKQIGKDTGLGLATVQAIVRGHDGFIRLESAPGKGTRFDLYFPPHPG